MNKNNYQEIFSRKEAKYILTKDQYQNLMSDIEEYIRPDSLFPHSETKSIYYDTDNFELARKCLEKPEYRIKIRLRSYEGSNQQFFEQKSKYHGTTYKRRQEVDHTINDVPVLPETQISREIQFIIKNKELKPKIAIAYSRDSYSGADGSDLRLTFDNNIRYSVDNPATQTKFKKGILNDDYHILEIKTLFAMPQWLCNSLNKNRIYPTSFSKYVNVYQQEILAKKEESC